MTLAAKIFLKDAHNFLRNSKCGKKSIFKFSIKRYGHMGKPHGNNVPKPV